MATNEYGVSGYQAGLLGWLAKHVCTVEIISELVRSARQFLSQLGDENVEVITANRSIGWKAGVLYDAIIVAAASPMVPHPLVEQLQEGGRLVLPVGAFSGGRKSEIRYLLCLNQPHQ